jgi:hypothetical protein
VLKKPFLGPHRFTQKQPPTSVSAQRSVAAVETAKNQLSRDFRGSSIFDFFNNIGQKLTSLDWQLLAQSGRSVNW